MEKIFHPKDIEQKTYDFWETRGYFKPQGKGPSFSVVIPPPNVTGILHMGHALNHTLQDILVRTKRMQGYQVLWLPGSDHAGIATQNVVEKQLKKEGLSRFDLGRDAFIEKVWQWKKEYGGAITSQIRRLGDSVDWSRERFTMDDGLAKAVTHTFVTLYKKNLVYRGSYIINWCPRCETALSDVEVNHRDADGQLWVIRYPAEDGSEGLTIATTRPETLFGDVAVAIQPDDQRYRHLIGKNLKLPLTDRLIPVIADDHVDASFGTGAVKVTPAHDANDFEIGERHNLEKRLIMTEKAMMNDAVPAAYQGLSREHCRKQVIEDLTEQGLLVEIREHTLSKAHCYRCETVIEPYLSKQWFVKMKPLAEPALAAVRKGDIKFTPKRWEKLYFEWMENIRDWCISRQIWWGHRIPVWYCETCLDNEPIVSEVTPEHCPKCKSETLNQDPDVLDTWFSSALWPFSTMGWPEEKDDLNRFYPTNYLVTGYDIITFWVSRMITMGLELTNKAPFSDVYIHGLVRDIAGKKMSKSVGNAIDPLELIDEYGADALRFALASQSTLGGQDIKFSVEKVESCRNFANKIWNATRYTLMVQEQHPNSDFSDPFAFPKSLEVQWILSHLTKTLASVDQSLTDFNYAQAADTLWDFTWNTFCDWYVELSKLDKEHSGAVLLYVLIQILKISHPFMPFITETIWQSLKSNLTLDSEALILAPWPKPQPELRNQKAEQHMDFIIKIIREIRHVRQQMNVQAGKEIDLIIVSTNDLEHEALTTGQRYIETLAKAGKIEILRSIKEKPKKSASSVIQNTQFFIPLKDLIDIDEETGRLEKRLLSIDDDLKRLTNKLSNPGFLKNAPDDVIEKIQKQKETGIAEKILITAQLTEWKD